MTEGDPAVRSELRLSVVALERSADPDLMVVRWLVDRVRRQRGHDDVEAISVRAQDLCVTAERLGLHPAALPAWLADRGVLVHG